MLGVVSRDTDADYSCLRTSDASTSLWKKQQTANEQTGEEQWLNDKRKTNQRNEQSIERTLNEQRLNSWTADNNGSSSMNDPFRTAWGFCLMSWIGLLLSPSIYTEMAAMMYPALTSSQVHIPVDSGPDRLCLPTFYPYITRFTSQFNCSSMAVASMGPQRYNFYTQDIT